MGVQQKNRGENCVLLQSYHTPNGCYKTLSLMRNFTVSNSYKGSRSFTLNFEAFFSSLSLPLSRSLFYYKVFGVYMAVRKASRPQIISLPFPASFHHFSSLAHHSFTFFLDILPTVISVLTCTLFSCFLLPSPLRSTRLPISCQASPWRITKGTENNQTTLLSCPTPIPIKITTWVLNNEPLLFVGDTRWGLFLDMALVSYFIFHSWNLFI